MDFTKATRCALGVLLGVVAVPLVACTLTAEGDVGGNTVRISAETHGNRGTITSSPPISGNVTICFLDEDGNSTGSQTGPLPFEGVVPPGTASFEAKDAEAPQRLMGPTVDGPGRVGKLTEWLFFGGAIGEPNISKGFLEYDIRVWAKTSSEAQATCKEIKDSVFEGTPLPGGVFDIKYARYTILVGTEVMFSFADERGFTQLDLELNGSPYADLDDATESSRGGLQIASVLVPVDDLNWGTLPMTSYRNDYALTLNTTTRPGTVVTHDGFFEYEF